jgi:hypothetical protein
MRARWCLALLACLISGCGATFGGMFSGSQAVKGSGVLARESRPAADVRSVSLSAAIQGEITVGAEAALEIEADDNLMPFVVTEVVNDRLVVRMKANTSTSTRNPFVARIALGQLEALDISGAARATVAARSGGVALRSIEASGASQVVAAGLATDRLAIDTEGAAKLRLSGRARALAVDASGATRVEAAGLTSEEADVDLSGASSAEIQKPRDLRSRTSGASRLETVEPTFTAEAR